MTDFNKRLRAAVRELELVERDRAQLDQLATHEEDLVRELGEHIGYGRTIQLCERLWGEKLPGGVSPAAHATAELQRLRAREPLVQAVIEAARRHSRNECEQWEVAKAAEALMLGAGNG